MATVAFSPYFTLPFQYSLLIPPVATTQPLKRSKNTQTVRNALGMIARMPEQSQIQFLLCVLKHAEFSIEREVCQKVARELNIGKSVGM